MLDPTRADRIVNAFLERQGALPGEEGAPAPRKKTRGRDPRVNPEAVYSPKVELAINTRFRRIKPFFDLYVDLRRVYLHQGPPPEGGFKTAFQQRARAAFRFLTQEETKDRFMELSAQIKVGLAQLDVQLRGGRGGNMAGLFRRFIPAISELIPEILADRDVFVAPRRLPGYGGWVSFRAMSPREQGVARLKRNNPEMYDAYLKSREIAQRLDTKIKKEIREQGLDYQRSRIMGAVVHVGKDPATQEEYVFTREGDLQTIDEFKESRKKELKERRKHERTFPDLDDLRTVDDDLIERVGGTEGADYIALTDDKAKQKQLTRIYPVKKILGEEVVVGGRFKGFLVADLVNRTGRLIEGAAYDFDPKRGRPVPIETKNPDGSPNVSVTREPYATMAPDGRLYLKIPKSRDYTQHRNAMKELARLVPSIELVPKSYSGTFYFESKDFGAVKDALGGFAMSKVAAETVKTHFMEEAKADAALEEGNLRRYSMKAIGGFKSSAPDLYRRQQQSLAWLDNRGGSGLVALDTGVGKCTEENTLIATSRGLVKIKDMNPGITKPDTHAPVEGWSVVVDGENLPVKSFYYGGEKPTRKVTTQLGLELEGSLVHPLLVRVVSGKEDWLKMPDLQIGDFLCVERKEGKFPTEEPYLCVPTQGDFQKNAKISKVPYRLNPELARLLGYIVGEGWFHDHPSKFTISQDPEKNPEVRADIEHLLKTQLDFEVSTQEPSIQVGWVFLKQYLSGMGVVEGVAKDKRVPHPVLQGTRESNIQFLRGLIDAEGSVDASHGIEFSSASEELTRTVHVMLLRLGIVSRRSTKKVTGYEHNTYWRLSILGDEARRYAEIIGMVSARKQEQLDLLVVKQGNPNRDVVPHTAHLVEALHTAIMAQHPGNVQNFRDRYGSSLHNTMNHVRFGRRNATYGFLRKLLGLAADFNRQEMPEFQALAQVVSRGFYYDPIVSLEESTAVVMDIEVDDPSHCFVGNGLVNHNTLLSLASMQRLSKYGEELAEQEGRPNNGRFLYVCEAKLRGNLIMEAHIYMEHPDILLNKTDIISYREFTQRRTSDPEYGKDYIAVYFDEAQALKTNTSKTHKAVATLDNPRKVLLTASPMERDPKELFTLAALANNVDTTSPEWRRERDQFIRRFCETVGARVIGLKSDPQTVRDFRKWVKQNLFYADKRDIEEFNLPQLRRKTETVMMEPHVESAYREVTNEIAETLRGLTAKYRDRDVTADDPALEKARITLARQFSELSLLSNMPERVFPFDMTTGEPTRNPKLDRATEITDEKVSSGGRILLFTDSPDFAEASVANMQKRFPGRAHAVGLSDRIEIWMDDQKLKTYRAKDYTDADGQVWDKGQWQLFVIRKIISPNTVILTLTLTSAYAVGQNLQAFDTVIHLDRDSWNNETMKQRTARSWRKGQSNTVEEYTLDSVYENTTDELDSTLDQIRGYMQEMEADLFDSVVIQSQTEALGKEWFGMKRQDASFYELNRRMAEMAVSPYLKRHGRETHPTDTVVK